MKQPAAYKKLKETFVAQFGKENVRFIKIHGSKYQEAGLPDVMVLVNYSIPSSGSITHRYWIEIKRDWNDTPTALQQYNIVNLRSHGYQTGYYIGGEFKLNWTDVVAWNFSDYLGKYFRKSI